MNVPVSPSLAKKVTLLSALYFVQGLPFGFQANALPQYLRQSNVSLTGIGLAGALAVPWMLKALWAPFVDRHGSTRFGRRKSWIVPMQGLMAICCAAAAFLPPAGALMPLLVTVLLLNLFAATQDIAVDGLAVSLLKEKELGLGNAAQVVGYKFGMLTGGGLLVWASASIGWMGLFLSMSALCTAVMISTLISREPAPDSTGHGAEAPTLKEIFARMKVAVAQPGSLWVLAIIATYKIGEAMADRMLGPFLTDHGIEPAQSGLWLGTFGMVASVSGSLFGGFLASRRPLLQAIVVTAALRVVPLLLQWALGAGLLPVDAETVVPITCVEHFFGGALTTCLFAFMMSKVDPRIGGTHYTLLASVEVLGKAPTGMLSGLLADKTSYATVFGTAAALSAGFVLLAMIAGKKLEPQRQAGVALG